MNKLKSLAAAITALTMCFSGAAAFDDVNNMPTIIDSADAPVITALNITDDADSAEKQDEPDAAGEQGEKDKASSTKEKASEEKANSAPVAENFECETYRNTSVCGQLLATDPDGDSFTFELVTKPRKGTMELDANGFFTYTPNEGKKGKDYFGFRAVDLSGNKSQEATAIISIQKKQTKLTYSDMSGNGSEYAALCLAENDIFVGSNLGSSSVFEPERTVSRGEFLAMCLKMSGADVLRGVTRTGFSDDAQMPAWVKPYVSTALLSGVISGYDSKGAPVFDSDSPISALEAAALLNRILGISDVTAVSNMTDDTIPVWGSQALINLRACKILPLQIDSHADCITRAEAAQMLVGAINLLNNREK